MQKIRFELDPYNRLILDRTGDKSGLTKFREVLDGEFKIDGNNGLAYHIKTPLPKDDNIPNQIRLFGRWSLTSDHELRLILDKSSRKTFGDQITLQGDILDVQDNALLFALTTASKDNARSTYVLNLSGSWKADENNRLSFYIRKEGGEYDILTFSGSWEINKNHQIIYKYEKARLLRKKRQTNTLMFKGYWDIKDKARISYVLSAGTDSVFDFTASAGIFKNDYIRYEIGIGSSQYRNKSLRIVKLFGRWNLKKDVGLVFEIEYENGAMRAIVFGADARITDNDTISFRLKDDIENKDIGAYLELDRKVFKGDGEAFVKVLASKREFTIYAGAAWGW